MYSIWTLFYIIFHVYAGRTEILIKQSDIIRKNMLETSKNWTLKQGWMLMSKISCNLFGGWNFKPTLCCLWANYMAVICFSDLVLCNKTPRGKVTPSMHGSRPSRTRLGPRSRRWSGADFKSYARTQLESNLRRHNQIGFQYLPWKR